jgi:hypothetical protein
MNFTYLYLPRIHLTEQCFLGIASGVIFYVSLYQNIHVKFICTVLCNFKDPTWILCEFDFMCKIYLYRIL